MADSGVDKTANELAEKLIIEQNQETSEENEKVEKKEEEEEEKKISKQPTRKHERKNSYSKELASIEIPKATIADEAVLALKLGYGCAHSPSEPCPECHTAFCNWLKALYKTFKEKLGMEHDLTLNALIDCAYELIKAYQLTACDELLMEGYEQCKARGRDDTYYIKMIQALAFLRFKQFQFADAVRLFEEMKEILGPNPSLLENMGHAYNSIGDQKNAEKCFTEALELTENDKTHKAHRGGLLLGLGLVKSRLGKPEEGLIQLKEALKWYIDEHNGNDNALIAKAHVSVAGTLEQIEKFSEAEDHYKEAVRIFKVTCGQVNPLTADALRKLGLCLLAQDKWSESDKCLEEALISTVGIDAFSINLSNVTELVIAILQAQHKLGVPQKPYFLPLIRQTLQKLLSKDESIINNPNFNILFQLCLRDIPQEKIAEITEAANSNS